MVRSASSPLQARNEAREYLQARILGILQSRGAMIPLAFHGGTALRFLYATARYSEDLDFSLERRANEYDIRSLLNAIQRELSLEDYEVQLKVNDKKTVHNAFVRFPGLYNETGLIPAPAGDLVDQTGSGHSSPGGSRPDHDGYPPASSPAAPAS